MIELKPGEVSTASNGGCVICSTLVGPFHIHHVIPRAFGGNDGPLAKLCNSCHETLHDIAKKHTLDVASYIDNGDKAQHLRRIKDSKLKQQVIGILTQLLNILYKSEEVAKRSNNKTIKLGLELTSEENELLVNAAKRLGLSKSATVKHLIRSLEVKRR